MQIAGNPFNSNTLLPRFLYYAVKITSESSERLAVLTAFESAFR